jgi:hypothetical protein
VVRAVFEELAQTRPAGLRYAVFNRPDSRQFIHLYTDEGSASGVQGLASFQAFVAGAEDRPSSSASVRSRGSSRARARWCCTARRRAPPRRPTIPGPRGRTPCASPRPSCSCPAGAGGRTRCLRSYHRAWRATQGRRSSPLASRAPRRAPGRSRASSRCSSTSTCATCCRLSTSRRSSCTETAGRRPQVTFTGVSAHLGDRSVARYGPARPPRRSIGCPAVPLAPTVCGSVTGPRCAESVHAAVRYDTSASPNLILL